MATVEYQFCRLDSGLMVPVKIVYESRIQKVIRFFNHMDAQTTWTTIRYYCPKNTLNATTINHEMQHVRQWKRLGFFRFLWQYYGEMIRHGYDKNAFEQEARRAAREPER